MAHDSVAQPARVERLADRPVPRLLVVDDDLELCELLTEYLQPEGFEVDAVFDGLQGVDRALSGDYSLLILDVMLPGIRGFEALRQIRAKSSMPIIMLTARDEDIDRILGLEIGADDYLAKPFNPRELAARIQAVLRRSASTTRASGCRRAATDRAWRCGTRRERAHGAPRKSRSGPDLGRI